MAAAQESDAVLREARETLAEKNIPEVESVTLLDIRTPHRLQVEINASEIPEGVDDIVRTKALQIVDSFIENGNLVVHLIAPSVFKPAGNVELRRHGNSVVATLSPTARVRAGFELGDRVSVFAKDGEISLRPQ